MATARKEREITLNDILMLPHEHDAGERCGHCGRDNADRDYEMVQEALRGRIRVLEAKVRDLELMLTKYN
jgi:hypothetical protein